ncbi:head GIN domain-containing protein [Winogradskyella alexanderae]|uniref:DUF2807 domain-containing protein n=1 Tax=Winogradskyella alexanderae TaxID=2877123 RepID=A0ABS7XSA8_9FLAO|nr:head GIN domain-containing protein [Winogradskyella alexanderae]MCA0132293.1 DUF2807 domain-containing protein [Winogradskyella alexanderae]
MSTLVRIIITSIVSLLMLSCIADFNMGMGVDGNGKVVTTDRTIPDNFKNVKVSQGLELVITQGNNVGITIEADENLHELIMTEVENNTLKIYSTENIRRTSARKIMLDLIDVESIKATSGSDVFSTNTIEVDELEINCTSGAEITLNVKTESLNCHSTSGSDVKLSGSTNLLIAEATSGSDIRASNLRANTSKVKATSGADITVNTSKELTARASSGGDIRYSGNPEKVEKSDSSSGSVRKQ